MNTYETTKEMNHAHSQWFIQYLHTNGRLPVVEIHERLTEIRYNLADRMKELRYMGDVATINEELAELAKAMIFYDRLFPQVEQEVFRVLRDLETICAEGYRTYRVNMDFNSFQQDRVTFYLVNSQEKRMEFKTNSRFRHYDSGFPAKWLEMDAAAIKKEMR